MTSDNDTRTIADQNQMIAEHSDSKKRKAGAVLDSLETEETKSLDNDQLQRYLMLKQVKLVELQLEKLQNEKKEEPVSVHFVQWDDKESTDTVTVNESDV